MKWNSFQVGVAPDDNEKSEGSDPLHWQLRKEFHLAKYSVSFGIGICLEIGVHIK